MMGNLRIHKNLRPVMVPKYKHLIEFLFRDKAISPRIPDSRTVIGADFFVRRGLKSDTPGLATNSIFFCFLFCQKIIDLPGGKIYAD